MNKQAFIENIQQSPLAEERKQKILALLENNDLTSDIKEAIKDIIQEDIESDAIALDGEDLVVAKALEEQLVTDLAAVEKDLGDNMSFVETELGDMEKMVQDMNKAVDEKQIEELKADIGA